MIKLGLPRVVLAVVAAATLACASGGASNAGSTEPAPKRDRTVILADDMKELAVSNLLEVVQRLHPEWLTPRNGGSIPSSKARGAAGGASTQVAVQVYIDTQHAGTTEILGQLQLSSAASLKYYSASEAQSRFGNGNMYGAIQVVSVTRR